jgi:hypothetical protein
MFFDITNKNYFDKSKLIKFNFNDYYNIVLLKIEEYVNEVSSTLNLNLEEFTAESDIEYTLKSTINMIENYGNNVIARYLKNRGKKLLNILKLVKSNKTFYIYVNRYDLKTQMIALSKIKSCLSPGGCKFNYSLNYLIHLYNNLNSQDFYGVVFGVIFNEKLNIIGRFTLLYCKYNDSNCIFRISSIYTNNVLIPDYVVDSVLSKNLENYNVLPKQKIEVYVPNINFDLYDDYAQSCKGGKILLDLNYFY